MAPLATAHWIVSPTCNYQCPFCYMPHCAPRVEGDRTWVLDRLAEGGVRQVTLTGGEALLAPDIGALITHAAKVGVPPVLHTNGSLLTREMLQAWAPHLGAIRFGLEGATPVSASKMRRQQGHLERVLQGIAWARELGVEVGVQTMVSAENIQELPAMAELLRNALPPQKSSLWFLSEFTPFRGAARTSQRFTLAAGDFKRGVDALPKLPFRVYAKTHLEVAGTGYFNIDPNGRVFTLNPSTGQDTSVGSLRDTPAGSLWGLIKILHLW